MAVTSGASICNAVFIMGEKCMKLVLLHKLLKDPVKRSSSTHKLFQKCVNCLFDGSLPFCILTFLIMVNSYANSHVYWTQNWAKLDS